MNIEELMAKHWDERANKNVYRFVALKHWRTQQEFIASGLSHAKRILRISQNEEIENSRVLDLGGGIGRIAVHLAPFVKELVLIDVSSEMIKIAKERLKDFRNVTLLRCNGLDFSGLSDSSFDLVYSVWVFQHIPRKIFLGYLKENSRILKPDGILVFQIFEKLKVFGLIPKYWLRNLRHLHFCFWKSPPDEDTWTARSYSRKELKELLEKTGFEVLRFENPTHTEGDLWVTASRAQESKLR